MRIRPVHNGQGKDHEKTFPCTLFTTITFPSLYPASFNHFWTLANKQDLPKPSLSKGRFLSVTRPKLFPPALLLGQFGNTDLVPALTLQKSMRVLTLTLWR